MPLGGDAYNSTRASETQNTRLDCLLEPTTPVRERHEAPPEPDTSAEGPGPGAATGSGTLIFPIRDGLARPRAHGAVGSPMPARVRGREWGGQKVAGMKGKGKEEDAAERGGQIGENIHGRATQDAEWRCCIV